MANPVALNIEADEVITLDSSTAPTTPEESLACSPVLRPLANIDGLDDDVAGPQPARRSLSSAPLSTASSANNLIRNICCVGAGYVGASGLSWNPGFVAETSLCLLNAMNRGPNGSRNGLPEPAHPRFRRRQRS